MLETILLLWKVDLNGYKSNIYVLLQLHSVPTREVWVFLLKACAICFHVERCLLASKDTTPFGPLWCDLTEDEKPKLRLWALRAEHLKMNSHHTALPVHCCISMNCTQLLLQYRDVEQSVSCTQQYRQRQKSLGNGDDSCRQIQCAWILDEGEMLITWGLDIRILFSTRP